MLNIYYKIWVDAIVYEKTKHGHIRNWKVYTLVPISIIQGVNFLTMFLIFGYIKGDFIDIFIDFELFPGKMLNSFLSGVITLILPFILLNYFLIFFRSKYEVLLTRNSYHNGKVYLIYFVVSVALFLLPLITGIVFNLI